MAVPELRTHAIALREGPVVLRPLTEADWDTIASWNTDPKVLYYAEGGDVVSRTMDEVRAIFRHVSATAFCFVIEHDGEAVGDCWLQSLNLDRLRERFPGLDCRRIDLALARTAWGRGIGGVAVRLLVAFAFEQQKADAVFACDVADYNRRSQRLFEREGFRIIGTNPQPPAAKASVTLDLVRLRDAASA